MVKYHEKSLSKQKSSADYSKYSAMKRNKSQKQNFYTEHVSMDEKNMKRNELYHIESFKEKHPTLI